MQPLDRVQKRFTKIRGYPSQEGILIAKDDCSFSEKQVWLNNISGGLRMCRQNQKFEEIPGFFYSKPPKPIVPILLHLPPSLTQLWRNGLP
jgi:hypothetical protein